MLSSLQAHANKMKDKCCFIIVGPTASGKTFFAIQLAKHFNTQIISADSRQCYKELNIGVAKPSFQQLKEVNHLFISSHSIHQQVNAKVFETYADDAVNTIFNNNDVAVMVGGTGLYINAFCNGIDEIPAIDQQIKNDIMLNFESNGIEWLQNEIEKKDPDYFVKGEIKNPQRLIRALEVKLSTGRSITEFQIQHKKQQAFKIIKIGIELPKEQLYQNINNRVDNMIQQGLVDEVRSLLPYQHLNALNTVGYKEIFAYFSEEITLTESIEKIKLNTRHYAKRQMTWFKKDKEVKWIKLAEGETVIDICSELYLRNLKVQKQFS